MNLNTLRYLDRKIGIPLCHLFYFFKKIFHGSARAHFDQKKIKKILVIKIWGMGSIIMASPLFQNLREKFPNAEIWFLTQEGFESIYPKLFFDHIEILKLKGFFQAVVDFFRLISRFRREKFDLVIDLEIVSRYTALISLLSGARIKVGFEILGQNKDKLYDYKAIYRESKHISEIFLGTLKCLDLESRFCLPAGPEYSLNDETGVGEILWDQKAPKPYVIANINASELALERRLPLEIYQKVLSDLLLAFPGFSVFLVGSQKEREYVEKFKKSFFGSESRIVNLAGRVTLAQLFALIKNAKLFISNDSGPAQAAAALKVPSIIFFGPESPAIYGPFEEKVKIFYHGLFCSPCISVYREKKIDCKNKQKCMSFEAAAIHRAVQDFLKE